MILSRGVQRRLPSLLVTAVSALMPSFLQRSATKLHSTSYLAGLRGLATLCVFGYHYTDYNWKSFLPAYNSNPASIGSPVLQLPYVRVIYNGLPMVHIFFVISGFVLALRPLEALYEREVCMRGKTQTKDDPETHKRQREINFAKCASTLASSALRRPIRLWTPPIVLTFLYIPLIRLAPKSLQHRPKQTAWLQIEDWAVDAVQNIAWPWAWVEDAPHSISNPHLWTIPIEFANSLLLYLILLVVSRFRTKQLRQLALATISVSSLVLYGQWAAFEFVAGAFLANFHLSSIVDTIPTFQNTERLESLENPTAKSYTAGCSCYVMTAIQILVLLATGYIFSWPTRPIDITPSYQWLQSHVPSPFFVTIGGEHRGRSFWYAVSAVALVWTCGHLPAAKRVLESRFAQYAGNISFAFYILQHSVLTISEHQILRVVGVAGSEDNAEVRKGLPGQSTPVQRTASWVLGLGILGVMNIVIADLFTRVVDMPSVQAARKFEKWCCGADEKKKSTLFIRK